MSLIIGLTENGLLTGYLEVDAAITETYTSRAQVTSDPIEYGASVSDHIFNQPDTATIEGVHSNYPAIFAAGLRVEPVRAEKLDEALLEAKEKGTVLDIFGSLRNLVNYVITDYTVTRDAATANGLRFRLTVQHLLTVQAQTVSSAPTPSVDRAYPPVWVGLLAAHRAAQAVTVAAGTALISWGNS